MSSISSSQEGSLDSVTAFRSLLRQEHIKIAAQSTVSFPLNYHTLSTGKKGIWAEKCLEHVQDVNTRNSFIAFLKDQYIALSAQADIPLPAEFDSISDASIALWAENCEKQIESMRNTGETAKNLETFLKKERTSRARKRINYVRQAVQDQIANLAINQRNVTMR